MKKLFVFTLLTFSLNANGFNIIAESNSWSQNKRDYCYKEGLRLSNMTQKEFNDNAEKAISEFKDISAYCNAVPDSLIMENYSKLTDSIAKLENAETDLEEKAKVLSVLKKYSETVACVTSFDGQSSLETFLKDVYTIERDPEFGSATYYVLWHGDIGCFGGSGTHNYIISEIARDTVSRRFLVKNNDAFGKNIYEQINTRFIESIRQENPNHFIIVSSQLAKDDPVNFPSLKYQYILQRQDGSWKITSRKPLAQ